MTVADVTVAESAGTMDFVITLSNASALTPSIDWKLTDVTTASGADYSAASANGVTFSEVETTKTISITVTNDTIDETASETFTFEVDRNDANLTGGSIGAWDVVTSEATGTITDDDAVPTITVSDKTYAEAAGTTAYTGTEIFLSHGSDTAITVEYGGNGGSGAATFNAVDSEDYTDTTGTLTFNAGTTVPAANLAITILAEAANKDENDEVFNIVFSNIAGGVAASTETFTTDGTAAITITDDDPAPTVSIAAVTQAEAGGAAVFTATLTARSGKTVTLQIDTADGDTNAATAGTDYTAITASTLTFAADTDLTKTQSVAVANDAIDEEDQQYKVVGSNFTNTSENAAGDATAVGTITDDDAAPLVYITDVTRTETEASQTFAFTVGLDNRANSGTNPGASEKPIYVIYATSAGATNPATAGSDYTAISTTALILAAGTSSGTINVTVAGDTTDELAQTFKITLSSPTNATLDTNNDLGNTSGADNIAVGTITDNDAAPTISVDDIAILESAAGAASTTTSPFTVTLSEASELPVTVAVALSTSDATSGTDYGAAFTESDGANDGTLNFAAGDLTETVTVTVNGDTIDETNQTFNINLATPTTTGSTPVISDSQGVATITDDDPAPSISINDITVLESAGTGTYAVTLDAASEQNVTVDFVAATGTTNGATAGSDFVATSGTLTFTAGDQSENVPVTVNVDTIDEEDQTVKVTLSNAASASGSTPALADAIGVLTITDDDSAPNITIGDVTQNEADTSDGAATFDFTISLDAASEKTVTVNYAVNDGSATDSNATALVAGGDDYDKVAGTTLVDDDSTAGDGAATFDPATADRTVVVSVSVNGDDTDEGNETFTVDLSGASNGTLSDNQGVGTITDDDPTPIITLGDVTIPDEDNGGTNSQTFAATLSNPSSSTINANYTVAAGTASSTADFTAATGTIQFTAGNKVADTDISVVLTDDGVYEGAETFTVKLDTATNAVFS
ncbi:MAG: Calx-beta domain-containing protein, partial [Candidatus Poribacteria bacterium]